MGAIIAYGYMKDPDDPKHIVPDPEQRLSSNESLRCTQAAMASRR
ncbi:hypothetical protein [Ruminococcus sp.]|nr:hypothetical protein [Ruminococcus sp.]